MTILMSADNTITHPGAHTYTMLTDLSQLITMITVPLFTCASAADWSVPSYAKAGLNH